MAPLNTPSYHPSPTSPCLNTNLNAQTSKPHNTGRSFSGNRSNSNLGKTLGGHGSSSGGGSSAAGVPMGASAATRPRGHRGRFVSQNKERHRRCKKCQIDETSQWRTAEDGKGSLCNACGIRTKRDNKKQKERAKSTMQKHMLPPLQPSPRTVDTTLPPFHELDAPLTQQKPTKRRKSRTPSIMDVSQLLN